MIELIGSELIAPDIQDRTLCQIAAERSSESKPLMPISVKDPLLFVGKEWTPRVLQGLAKISLQPPDSDCHGISQAQADYLIGELSGDVAEFFHSFLSQT
jgi:hypothetical protein